MATRAILGIQETMLEHSLLLVHRWMRTALSDGEAWVRPITDASDKPLGFVRHRQLRTLPWFFWLRNTRLEVFETDDASHLMTLVRSWAVFSIWDLQDAEDRHVGSVYPKTLLTDEGESLGFLDRNPGDQGRILDPHGDPLVTFRKKKPADALEVAFASLPVVNPFLRMLLLGCVLTLDPKP